MLPTIGKIDKEVFNEKIGEKAKAIILGPQHGVDAAAVSLGDRVLVIAEDPTFCIRSSCHILDGPSAYLC